MMNLDTRIKAVWLREQLLHVTKGVLALLPCFLAILIAGGLLDWIIKFPSGVRVVLLLLAVGVPLFAAWRLGWRRLRAFNPTHTALRIEESMGGMNSLLVTAIQFRQAQPDGTSQALAELACRQAEEASGGIEKDKVVRLDPLYQPAGIAACGLLVAAVFFGALAVTNGDMLAAGFGRFFAPLLPIEYPTRTKMKLVSEDIVVQEGNPVRIAAELSGVVPRKAKIAIRTGTGKPRVRKLDVSDNECEYKIATAFRSFDYRLQAGDARSEWHTVEVVPAPAITQAAVKLDFPRYTGKSTETVEALTLTVPETTTITWTLTLDRAVREAAINLAGEDPVPMDISSDGLTVSFRKIAADSRAYAFSWVERDHGFQFKSPSNYLQVAPDRPPRVELTQPNRNLYATLGRKLDLAFIGRDDHEVAETVIAYRVDKTEEVKIPFKPVKPVDGSEQTIDWDYRTVLPDLRVGQTLTLAIELTDRYPGAKGPHRVRSDARRIRFMSKEDYLAQVERQKKRLLSQLRTIYREEREVHEVIIRLDPRDPVFIQTCQLEAVRQDLTRERLRKLAGRMQDLTDDLAANSIEDQAVSAALTQLRADLLRIGSENVSNAAKALRSLAAESSEKGSKLSSLANAAHQVNSAARELGLLVLHLGYLDAADVMARELHAAAETQAALRLRTILLTTGDAKLAGEQERLQKWLTRLFEASPKGKESDVTEALVEFTLTRLVKQMVNGGIDKRLAQAAGLIRDGKSEESARLQAEVIQALLKAEFRLRVGSEREALVKARTLFLKQAEEQKKLRTEITSLEASAFQKRRQELAEAQTGLITNLQLLLLPKIPARRVRLFDATVPAAPPVADLLATADEAMKTAAAQITAGKRDAAAAAQAKAESSFLTLAEIITNRIGVMTQRIRIDRMTYAAKELDERLEWFSERQLSLLEKTEDAAADGTESAYLGDQQDGLADSVDNLRDDLSRQINHAIVKTEHPLAVPARISEAVTLIRQAVPLLKANKPAEAAKLQKAAEAALASTRVLLEEHMVSVSSYAAAVGNADSAVKPSPYVREIEEEQRDMLALTKKTKPEDLPNLSIPQKNLIHAVNATLNALDPVAHMVESGTVMLFAKEDMDSAGVALAEKDSVEALDAQSFVVETLEKLRRQVDAVIPQYLYVVETVEALQETGQEGVLMREELRRLREKTLSGTDTAALTPELQKTRARAAAYGNLVNRICGLGVVDGAMEHLTAAEAALKAGNKPTAADEMKRAEDALAADAAEITNLMSLLAKLLAPPPPGVKLSTGPEVALLREVLAMAADHRPMSRRNCAAKPEQLAAFAEKVRAFETACTPFIERAREHKNPVIIPEDDGKKKKGVEPPPPPPPPTGPANLHLKLVTAKKHLGAAAAACNASDPAKVEVNHSKAAESLRHFVVEYTLKFFQPPPAGGSSDAPAATTEFNEAEDELTLYMPGAVTGTRPPDGKLDWEVLGKRDRAALNENFARELPLEYRAILQDYYERLAQ